MSRLTKARTFVRDPGAPGVPSRPAEVQCPFPPPGRTFVVRNGTYHLAAITTPSLPPTTRPDCRFEMHGGVRVLVCRSAFGFTPVGP